jgi:hypothetical protein
MVSWDFALHMPNPYFKVKTASVVSGIFQVIREDVEDEFQIGSHLLGRSRQGSVPQGFLEACRLAGLDGATDHQSLIGLSKIHGAVYRMEIVRSRKLKAQKAKKARGLCSNLLRTEQWMALMYTPSGYYVR